ncbi:MAG: Uma2 family endonuclease [Waterburya sp.]
MLSIVLKTNQDQSIYENKDKTITLADMTWSDYLELSQQNPEYRFTYYENIITAVSPSKNHERIKKTIGILIETYCRLKQIKFYAFGSADVKKPPLAAKQPDESYCFETEKDIPDLAVEVVFSSGGIKDLEKYKALDIKEVWFWQNNQLEIYVKTENNYTKTLNSFYLSQLNTELLNKYIGQGFIKDHLTIENNFAQEINDLSNK